MDKERFVCFRLDLAKLRYLIKENPSPQYVEDIFEALVVVYPELRADESSLPDLIVKGKDSSDHQTQKSLGVIREELIESISGTRFTDYSDIQIVMDNEETCLETLKTRESDSRFKEANYVLFMYARASIEKLREITGRKMSQLLKLTPHSQSHAYFLIKLYDLVQDYNKLMYSTLPVRYFKTNFKSILNICRSDVSIFK